MPTAMEAPEEKSEEPESAEDALIRACAAGDQATVATMLAATSMTDRLRLLRRVADSSGRGPLHHAAAGGNAELCTFLVEKGADVHAVDGTGQTSLHCACNGAHLDASALLVEFGAEMNPKDEKGRTPLDLATAAAATTATATEEGEEAEEAEELCEWLRFAGAEEGTPASDAKKEAQPPATSDPEPPVDPQAEPVSEMPAREPAAMREVLETMPFPDDEDEEDNVDEVDQPVASTAEPAVTISVPQECAQG